jgi:hypothetical protein
MKRIMIALLCLCCISAATLLGSSVTIGTDDGSNDFPFAGPFPGYTGTEYQEAYDSSDFSGPILITGIDFFLGDGFTGSLYSGTYTLSFSTISAGIGTLSSTDFSGNLGTDNTVFDTVALSGAAPKVLTFVGTTPFLYDPSEGNLLLNIAIAGGKGGSQAAYQDSEGAGTAVARYQNFGLDDGVGYGLVTEFDSNSGAVTTTPEPGTLPFLFCGLAGLVVWHLRRRRLS